MKILTIYQWRGDERGAEGPTRNQERFSGAEKKCDTMTILFVKRSRSESSCQRRRKESEGQKDGKKQDADEMNEWMRRIA